MTYIAKRAKIGILSCITCFLDTAIKKLFEMSVIPGCVMSLKSGCCDRSKASATDNRLSRPSISAPGAESVSFEVEVIEAVS